MLRAGLCHLPYQVASVCTEEAGTQGSPAAMAVTTGIRKDAPKGGQQASRDKCHSPKFLRDLLWNLGNNEPQAWNPD